MKPAIIQNYILNKIQFSWKKKRKKRKHFLKYTKNKDVFLKIKTSVYSLMNEPVRKAVYNFWTVYFTYLKKKNKNVNLSQQDIF